MLRHHVRVLAILVRANSPGFPGFFLTTRLYCFNIASTEATSLPLLLLSDVPAPSLGTSPVVLSLELSDTLGAPKTIFESVLMARAATLLLRIQPNLDDGTEGFGFCSNTLRLAGINSAPVVRTKTFRPSLTLFRISTLRTFSTVLIGSYRM